MPNHAILILAAGASRRLGQPKQLLAYEDGTLLNYMIKIAKEAELGPVYVVVGCKAEQIERLDAVTYIFNTEWAAGMGSSLACGVQQIREEDVSGLILMQCDQPYVDAHLLKTISDRAAHTGSGIVICDYGIGSGPPAYFSSVYFGALSSLKGDRGAKSIVKSNEADVSAVFFPKGRHDIDTIRDLDLLN